MSKKKILVVDDNLFIRKVLSLKLRAGGYEVLMAEDAPEAVRAVRQQRPNLILLDINFPNVPFGGVNWDGFQIMDWLERLKEAKDIPIIVITSDTSAECKERALAAGAAGFFPKPIQPEELLPAIRRFLGEGPAQS